MDEGMAGFGLASAVEGGRRMEDGGVRIEGGGCRARALTYVKRIGVGRAKSRRQRVWKPSSSQLQVAVNRRVKSGFSCRIHLRLTASDR